MFLIQNNFAVVARMYKKFSEREKKIEGGRSEVFLDMQSVLVFSNKLELKELKNFIYEMINEESLVLWSINRL